MRNPQNRKVQDKKIKEGMCSPRVMDEIHVSSCDRQA